MNDIILPQSFPAGAMAVICAPHAAADHISPLIVRLALGGTVRVLDGGNRLQAYPLTRLIRLHTPAVEEVSQRIHVRRAFTAYQMLALLEEISPSSVPCILLDLLASFYDETLPLNEAHSLLKRCLERSDALRVLAPVIVTLAPPPTPRRYSLFEAVCQRADALWLEPQPSAPPVQFSLF